MKTKNISFLLIVFILQVSIFKSNSYSQSRWLWKSPYPQGNPIQKIFTMPSGKLFCIGDCGTIMKSTNQGTSWSFKNKVCGLNDNLISYYYLDENIIFIGTERGKIIKTTDGGQNWNILCELGQNYNPFIPIDFPNAQIGYTVHDNNVLKSTNAGINWFQVFTPPNYSNIVDVEFITNEIGFASGGNYFSGGDAVFRTTNGGLNWVSVLSIGYSYAEGLKFVNSATGFAMSEQHLYKTTNQGINWGAYGTNLQYNLNTVFFFNAQTAYATFMGYEFRITTNGGYNWVSKPMLHYQVLGINFFDVNTGYLHGWNNRIHRTTDAGDNWVILTEKNGSGTGNDRIYDYYFFNNTTGYVVGWHDMIKKTTDQGETWQTIPCTQLGHNYGIDFINTTTGFIVGGNSGIGKLLKSTDGGNSWILFKSFANGYFTCIRFFNENIGLIGCQNDEIYRTSDGGNNWTRVDSSLYFGVSSIYTLNSTTGFAVGRINSNTGIIRKTTDTGLTWSTILTTSSISNIKFINNTTGFCVGKGASKTTDGGQTWIRILHNDYIKGIDFVNNSTGYISGNGGLIYKTTNGGSIWHGTDVPTKGTFWATKFFSPDTGLVFGEYGTILKTYDGGGNIISNISNQQNNFSTDYKLYQNFPNPFNPTTTIRYDIKEKSSVELKVFDLLGRQITTLVNENQTPGMYEVVFDASSLPSSVYFYLLQAGDFVDSKKMILLK